MKKKYWIIVLLFVCFIFISPQQNFVFAENATPQVVYFAFGDSIAEGTVLTNDGSYNTENRFPNLINNEIQKITSVQYANYAHAGDKLADFMNVVNGINNLNDATVITLDIGANDILMTGISAIPTTPSGISELLSGVDFQGDYETQIQNNLIAKVDTAMKEGADNFAQNFESDLKSFLSQLNNYAHVYVMSIYNPYEDVVICVDVSVSLFGMQLSLQLELDFDELTTKYLVEYENSINNTIYTTMENLQNDDEITQSLHLVDTYSAWNNYYINNGIEEYKKLLLVKDEARQSQTTPLTFEDISSMSYLLDPHPSDAGHELIAETYWAEMQNACSSFNLQTTYEYEEQSGILDGTTNQFDINNQIYLNSSIPANWQIMSSSSVLHATNNVNKYSLPMLEAGNYTLKVMPYGTYVQYLYPLTIVDNTPVIINPSIQSLAIRENYTGSGQINNYTFSIDVYNPSEVTYSVVWRVDDEIVSGDTTSVTYSPLTAGQHTVSATLSVNNAELTNTTKSQQFEATYNAIMPSIINISIDEIYTGEGNINKYAFELNVSNPDNVDFSVVWRVDGIMIDGDTINTTYTPLIAKLHTVNATLSVNDQEFSSTTTTQQFEATYNTIYPSIIDIFVNETYTGEGQLNNYMFSLNIDNPDEVTYNVVWRVDNEIVNGDTISLTYSPLTAGQHIVSATLSVNSEELTNTTTSKQFEAIYNKITPSIANISIDEVYTGEGNINNYTFTLDVVNLDNVDFSVIWRVDDVVISGNTTSTTHTPQTAGQHTVSATLIIENIELLDTQFETMFEATYNDEQPIEPDEPQPTLPNIVGISYREIVTSEGNFNKYEFTAIINNPDNIDYQLAWYVNGWLVGYGSPFTYTPSDQGACNYNAVIIVNDVSVSSSPYHFFDAVYNSFMPSITNILIEKVDNTTNEYLFTAQISNIDNVEFEIVWQLNDDIIGYGIQLLYQINPSETSNITAILQVNGEELQQFDYPLEAQITPPYVLYIICGIVSVFIITGIILAIISKKKEQSINI